MLLRVGPAPKVAPAQQRHSRPQVDVAAAEWDGRAFETSSSRGATMALARMLVAAGCPDQPWQAGDPAGQRLIHGNSLHRLAKLTIREDDRAFGVVRYQERPKNLPGMALGGVPEDDPLG